MTFKPYTGDELRKMYAMPGLSLISLDDSTVEAMNEREIHGESNDDADARIVDIDKITDLAALPPLEYDRQRVNAAKEMNIRTATLDNEVAKKRPAAREDDQPEFIIFPQREMWPDAVTDIARVLDTASSMILSFMTMEKHWGDVTALWCLHTYAVDCFPVSPRYAAESPTHECGKSTLLNVIKELVHRPLKTSNIQPAGIFRVVEQYSPTLIIDEGDSFLHDNEPLRGILNSGHAKGDHVIRVEGDPLTPKPYKVFGPCAFGLIGTLPPTLQSRSIANKLKRATAAERVGLKTFRTDRPPAGLAAIAAQFWRWAEDNRIRLAACEPDMGHLINRDADNWRVLFAIADVVGGDWPRRVRHAATKICQKPDELPINLELLSDIRGIVLDAGGEDKFGVIPTDDLLRALVALDSRPWADWKAGKPMTAKALASQLKPFEIFPMSDGARRGYHVWQMIDAFARYLPPLCVNAPEGQQTRAFSASFNVSVPIETDTSKNHENPRGTDTLDALTDRQGDFGRSAWVVEAERQNAEQYPDPEGWTFHLDDRSALNRRA